MSTYDDNEGSFDVHEKVDMLLKKSFGVVATKDSQLWFGENYGKSLTIFENDAINISSVPDEPLWEETPMDDVSLAEYNININTSNSFYDASFTGFNTIYYDNGVKKYTTGGEIFPGAYLDSTKTVILFVGLKLDRMETPSSTAAAEEDRALAFTKYPLDSSQNSILSNSFQFNYKKIGPGAIYNSDGGDSGETLWQPYTYQLRDSANTKIRFDEGNWFFDFKSGIITFSDSNDTAKDYPIYFTFVKYVGPRGLDKLISVDASFDSTDTVGYYENQIVVDSSNSEIYLLKYGSWNSIGGGGGSGGSGGAFTIDGSDNAYYNTGNVGIGTSTPFSTLDVSGSANITGNLTIGSSPINVESKLGELDTSINLLETRVSELDTSVNALETITTDISYITGTTTILNDLDVSGNLTLPGIEISGNDIRGDGMLDLFASTNSSDSIGWIELRTGATRIGGDSIKFRPNNTTDSAGTDLITMTSSGYLGIGTTDPSNELHVIGSASITGNIGIGTSDPSHVFHIDKSATDVSSVTFHSHVGTGSVDYITNQIQLQTHGTTGATTVNNIGYISSFVDNSTTVHDSTYGLELGTRRSIGTSSQIIESTAKIEISPESVILKGSVFMKYGDDNTILSTTRDDGTIYLGYSGELEVGTGNLLEISGNVNIRENHDLYVSGSTSISGDLTIGATSINVESQLGLLDDSISLLEDDISGLDASVNALETITTDISYASGTTTILNDLDVSGDVTVDGSLNIGMQTDVVSKFGLLDASVNLLETDISELDTSVNLLETITTDISYSSGTTTILNDLDVSGNLSIDGSLNLGTIQDVESKFGELDNSINLLETNVAELDTSVNVLETITTDISYITGTTSILNNLDVSGDLSIDGSLNLGTIQDVESKLGELDNSINYLETTISAFGTSSINALETITTDISYISGTTTITGNLDISSTDALLIPRGTTSERNSETPGALRFNRDTSLCEVYTQSNIWSGLPVYKTEQPPKMHSPSTTEENKSFTISWSKFDEIYKDAYDGKSYPIFLQTYVDVSYSGTSNQWKTIYIGPGNCNSSGNAATPSLSLTIPDSGFVFDDDDGTYSHNDIEFDDKPTDTHNIDDFDQSYKFDFRVYAVNNSGKTPNYLTIDQVGLKTTSEPSEPKVILTDTFGQNSFEIDTSFNVDKDNSGVTISDVTLDYYDISYVLKETKSFFKDRDHDSIFRANESSYTGDNSSKTDISLSGLYPGAVYEFQVQVKNTANHNKSGYGQPFTSSEFTHASDNNQYIVLDNLNNVDNDNMSFTKYNFSDDISLRINGGSGRTKYTLGNSNSYIDITGTSEFYVNYGLQGLDMSGETDMSLVEATFTIEEAGNSVSSQTITYYGTHDPDNVSSSTIDISNGATTYSYQFSSGSYNDEASSSYNNGGFVYSSTFYRSDGNSLSSIFNDNFKPSTNSYELLYNISSSSTQTNGASYIGKTNTTTGDITTSAFYVDDYSMNPVITFTTRPTLSTTATYLFGIPSVDTMSIDYDISISDFANYFIPSNDSGVHSGINEIVKDSYTITAHTYNSTNSNDSYNIKASGRSVTVNNDTNTGYYDADTSDNLSVYVYYLDHNSGAPTRLTQNASSEIYDIGHIFINSERTYSDYSLYTFDGVNTITSIGDMTISSFATTSPMDTDISTTLLRFDGKFVSGGYSTTYNGVTITPFSDWSSGYAVDGPDYNNYLNTGLNNFKWIAIDVTSKKSGSNVNLGGFKINDSSPDISKFGNTSDESGYEAYIYHGGKFGALKGAHSTGDTSWFLNDTYYGSISNANITNANGALQSSSDSGTVGVDAFIDESDSSNIYLIVGLPQNANSYFTFS